MACTDSRGLPLSTSSPEAARHYREGVDLLLSAWPGAAESLQRAVEVDGEFALGHAALARLHAIRAEPDEAKARIDAAGRIAARNGTAREQSHVATLAFAIAGQSGKAIDSALSHLENWPRDVLILSLPLGAFGLFAFSGMADHDQARVELCERHAAQFDADDWWFLAYRGWSLAENGDVGRGRDLVQRSFDLRPANANAAHALSHAMFEGGAGQDAETLIVNWLPSYHRSGTLHGHIAWHAALCALERGDPSTALVTYERHVQPSASLGLPINVMSDAVSLLWRLQIYGYEVPAKLWHAIKEYSETKYRRAGFAFVDAHMGLLSAATGDRSAANARIDALQGLLEQGALAAGPVVPAICRAALAFADGDYAACARILEPMSRDVVRIGGSGAQREIIEDTLLVAFMRGGDSDKARDLLDKRLHRRPSSRDARWRRHVAASATPPH